VDTLTRPRVSRFASFRDRIRTDRDSEQTESNSPALSGRFRSSRLPSRSSASPSQEPDAALGVRHADGRRPRGDWSPPSFVLVQDAAHRIGTDVAAGGRGARRPAPGEPAARRRQALAQEWRVSQRDAGDAATAGALGAVRQDPPLVLSANWKRSKPSSISTRFWPAARTPASRPRSPTPTTRRWPPATSPRSSMRRRRKSFRPWRTNPTRTALRR
jgi:hypothetical protein